MRKSGVIAATVTATVAIGIGAAAWFANKDEWFPLKDEVAATITANDPGCVEADRPLGVSLRNQSSSTVTWLRYEVSVGRVGHSSKHHTQDYTSDKILAPGEEVGYCVGQPGKDFPDLPNLRNIYAEFPNELEYSIEVTYADS